MGICHGMINHRSIEAKDSNVWFGSDGWNRISDKLQSGCVKDAYQVHQSPKLSLNQAPFFAVPPILANCVNDCQAGKVAIFVPFGGSGVVSANELRAVAVGYGAGRVAMKQVITTVLAYVEQQAAKVMVAQTIIDIIDPRHEMSAQEQVSISRRQVNKILDAASGRGPDGPLNDKECQILKALIELLREKSFINSLALMPINRVLWQAIDKLELFEAKWCKAQ